MEPDCILLSVQKRNKSYAVVLYAIYIYICMCVCVCVMPYCVCVCDGFLAQ